MVIKYKAKHEAVIIKILECLMLKTQAIRKVLSPISVAKIIKKLVKNAFIFQSFFAILQSFFLSFAIKIKKFTLKNDNADSFN
jgi:hypothetical protein